MVPVDGDDITYTAVRLKIVFAHQTLDWLVAGDHTSMTKRRLYTVPTMGFERVADRTVIAFNRSTLPVRTAGASWERFRA